MNGAPLLAIEHIPIKQISRVISYNYNANTISFRENRPCFGLFYKPSGVSECRIGSQSVIFDKDHVVIIPQNASYATYPKQFGRTHMIEFTCADDFVYDFSRMYCYRLQNPIIVGKLFSDAERIWTFKETAYYNRTLSVTYQIFAELEKSVSRPYLNRRLYEPLRRAQEYLEANYSNPELNVSALAEISELSPSYFRKLFLQFYKCSPGRYLQTIRMEKAKDLLSSGSCTVGEVAELVGYANIYYFSNAFKKAVGCSPSEYEAQM